MVGNTNAVSPSSHTKKEENAVSPDFVVGVDMCDFRFSTARGVDQSKIMTLGHVVCEPCATTNYSVACL